jgi:uncharacterized cupin superfamily protein
MHEAKLEQSEHGLVPADGGWFVVNARDIAWATVEGGGTWCLFEAPDAPSSTLGVGVHVLPPGESSGFYHAESDQEGFFILAGECLLIVEGEERRLRAFDYFHSPPGTAHMTVGAGEQGCTIFMFGTRSPDPQTEYLPDPVAQRHGVGVPEYTTSSQEAYKNRPPIRPAPSPLPGPAGASE